MPKRRQTHQNTRQTHQNTRQTHAKHTSDTSAIIAQNTRQTHENRLQTHVDPAPDTPKHTENTLQTHSRHINRHCGVGVAFKKPPHRVTSCVCRSILAEARKQTALLIEIRNALMADVAGPVPPELIEDDGEYLMTMDGPIKLK